jgi:KDO2-lipid IV(A) lauroyltransferase
MKPADDPRPPLTPRHWASWLVVGLFWLLGKTPPGFGFAVSRPLGWLLHRAMRGRRRIAERNIERCFPDRTEQERAHLLQAHFRGLARMLFETCWTWSMPDHRFQQLTRTEGLEHARRALASGKGILAISHHTTCLEIGGRMAGSAFPDSAGMYRPLKNPVIEWYQTRARRRYSERMISKRDMRTAIRYLRKGGYLWYAPDQDFGAKRSVFVPFFGIQTATLEATGRLIEMTNCVVLPMFPEFDPDRRCYTLHIHPPMDDLPSDDIVNDLARINEIMEQEVRRVPEQYWWIHRRFKTRPEGEQPFYD